MICPYCGGNWIRKKAIRGFKRRCYCNDCKRNFSVPRWQDKKRVPKVLVFDIETAPMKVFVWGLWKQRIHHKNVLEDWFCFSWSAKWLFDDEIMSDVLTPAEAKNKDDKRIIESMWQLLEEADCVIAHNGQGFDIKRLNTRFVLNGLTPPMPYQSIDTLKVARKRFSFASNRLDYLGKQFGIGGKIKADFDLWVDCYNGGEKALKGMVEYNQQDVLLLEEVYLKLRPYIKSHANMSLYAEAEGTACPNCGEEISHDQWKGYYYTPAGKYRAFRCECGSIGRSRFTSLSLEDRKHTPVSVAR